LIRTNKEWLIETAVQGVVQPASGRGFSVMWDGTPKNSIGTASINYTASIGDPVFKWKDADHVEPDVTIQGRDQKSPSDCAMAVLACIGNPAKVVSGDAKGSEGVFIGRHAGADDLVWFPDEVRDKLNIDDKIQIRAKGVGLTLEGFNTVKVNKCSPEFIEKIGITVKDGKLIVPVTKILPGYILGAGIGYDANVETVDYDIQTTCPETNEEFDLAGLNLGDLIAIENHYDAWGRGRYEGAITIGVIVHGWSDFAGHGPGVNPILAAKNGEIEPRPNPNSNIAYILGIREKSK
jgi:hypothetical protein